MTFGESETEAYLRVELKDAMGRAARTLATSSLHLNRWSAAMPQPNDLSRSLVALDHNSTIIAVVELSQSSWLADYYRVMHRV
jgi:hypothetical protein